MDKASFRLNTLEPTIQQFVNKKATNSGNMLVWAIICSILMHTLAIITVHNIQFEVKKPAIFTIELAPPAPPKPAPEPVAEPIKPKEPIAPPKPVERTPVKPLPKPMVSKPSSRVEPPSHEPVSETPPQVISAIPKVEATPTFTTPVPSLEPSKTVEPSEPDLDDAFSSYGKNITANVEKHKKYSAIAQRRRLEGVVIIEIAIDQNGNIISSKIKKSSDNAILDKDALTSVQQAAPFPKPPEILVNQISIKKFIIPIGYSIKSDN